jgi:chromatin remodeling complex protein RSC6
MSEEKKNAVPAADMKKLREVRKESIAGAREKMKGQNKIVKSLKQALAEEAKTIPELADIMGMQTDTVLMYVSTLKRYGLIGEGPKDGDYFKYELTE